MGVRKGETGISPLEIETKHQDFLENMKLVAQFQSIDYIFAMPLYFPYDTHTAQQPSSLFWCHAVISLQFTRVHSQARSQVFSKGGLKLWKQKP